MITARRVKLKHENMTHIVGKIPDLVATCTGSPTCLAQLCIWQWSLWSMNARISMNSTIWEAFRWREIVARVAA